MRKNNINLRILFFMLLSIVMIKTNAQTGLNFQGVARTTNNVILASQAITIKLSILQGSSTGTLEYSETRKVTTNAQGLFTAVIGDTGAISTLGNFTTINWKLTPKFLKIEMDAAAGTNFITMGTTQFQYVAYAQFAKSVDAENIVGIVPVSLGGTGVNSLTGLKTALALNNVNNTSDLNKPISTLSQTALDLKLNAADTTKYAKQTYSDSALLTKLKISDTTAMLSSRIARDTLSLSNRINLKANTTDVTSGLALKENISNKSTAVDLGGTSPSDILFPTQKAVKDYVAANSLGGGVANGGITTIKLADLAVTDTKLATGISKSKVGLSNVDNTSDLLKPVSTATLSAIAVNTASITSNATAVISEAITARAAELVLTNNLASHTSSTTSNATAVISEAITARAAELVLTNNLSSQTTSITALNTAVNAKQTSYINLTSIGSLTDAAGYLKNNGSGTYSYATPTKADLSLGNVENTTLSTWAGTNNITTLGTITSGLTVERTVGSSPNIKLIGGIYGYPKIWFYNTPNFSSGVIFYDGYNFNIDQPTVISGPAATASVGTSNVLKLSRDLNMPVSQNQYASFNLGRYAAPGGGYEGYTRLDFVLSGNTPSNTNENTIMTLQNNGQVLVNGKVIVGTSSDASASAVLEASSTTQGFLPPRMTSAQRTAIASPAEGLIVVQTDGTQGLYLYIGAAWHEIGSGGTHTIGETFGGGIVFYVTTGGLHGLIAETQDQSVLSSWYNAQDIISTKANHSDAGALFTDWRLPTKNELNLLYSQKSVVGGFADGGYWSSTENDYSYSYGYSASNGVWYQGFIYGNLGSNAKYNSAYVRAIRAF